MITYRKALPHEMPDVLDFINMVFSMKHGSCNFLEFMPKLYETGNEEKSVHYIAVEEDKIKAVVCVLPITLCHKDSNLICGTLGSVSVHPYSRGKGYMKKLMAMAVSDMKQNHIHFSNLVGLRNRYQYFGYETGGFYYEYRFRSENFRHCADRFPKHDITLLKITDADSPYLEKMQELSRNRPVFCSRNCEDFFTIARTWDSDLYAVLKDQDFQGYFSFHKNEISEFNLKDLSLTYSCLKSCFEKTNAKELLLRVSPFELSLCNTVSDLCEFFSVQADASYQIFDYPSVLQFFLDIQSDLRRLNDGVLDFTVKDAGNYRISVENGKASVTALDNPAALTLTPFEVISYMLSPKYYTCQELISTGYNWFPLPLEVLPLDKI